MELLESRWWEGPDWLSKNRDNWPNRNFVPDEKEINFEIKRSIQLVQINLTRNSEFYSKFSSYEKLIRFRAIVRRFIDITVIKKVYKDNRLIFREIFEAELQVLKQLQREMFLSKNDPKISSFKTFLHEDELIHVKTRITERKDDFFFLNPIILDGHHRIVKKCNVKDQINRDDVRTRSGRIIIKVIPLQLGD